MDENWGRKRRFVKVKISKDMVRGENVFFILKQPVKLAGPFKDKKEAKEWIANSKNPHETYILDTDNYEDYGW